jgi:protein Mpv17
LTALIQFTTVAIINTPIGYLWMTSLEATFPAYDDQLEKGKEKEKEEASPKLNIRNTILKVVLDQTIGGAAMTVLFLTTMALLRGAGSEEILESIYHVRIISSSGLSCLV